MSLDLNFLSILRIQATVALTLVLVILMYWTCQVFMYASHHFKLRIISLFIDLQS